ILFIDQRVIHGGDGILPDQLFLRHELAEGARARTHRGGGELETGPRERARELSRVLKKAARDLLRARIEARGEIGRKHRRLVLFRGVVRVGDGARAGIALGLPLMRARRALGELPLVAKEIDEEVVAPFGWSRSPGDFEAGADGVRADAGFKTAT